MKGGSKKTKKRCFESKGLSFLKKLFIIFVRIKNEYEKRFSTIGLFGSFRAVGIFRL